MAFGSRRTALAGALACAVTLAGAACPESTVMYDVHMSDSFGDGWNGRFEKKVQGGQQKKVPHKKCAHCFQLPLKRPNVALFAAATGNILKVTNCDGSYVDTAQ